MKITQVEAVLVGAPTPGCGLLSNRNYFYILLHTDEGLTGLGEATLESHDESVLGSLRDLEGSTVYVTLFPCHDCAKILAQVGIGEVVYLDNKYADTDDGRISRRILDSCGITYRQVLVDA